jgi:hypothetical protein
MLLEELNEVEKYPQLKLHCDWVLHSKLSGKKVQRLLEDINEVWTNWIERAIPLPPEFQHRLMETAGLYGFEEESVHFLSSPGIQAPSPAFRNSWQPFEELFCSVVKDCWLVYPSKKKPLKYIDCAQIRMIKATDGLPEGVEYNSEEYLPLALEWIFSKAGQDQVIRLTVTFPSKDLVERERRHGPTTKCADVALPLARKSHKNHPAPDR